MAKVNYDLLYEQLGSLMKDAPCNGKVCIGHLSCVYGISGCYGSVCAIEEVIQGMICQQIKDEALNILKGE